MQESGSPGLVLRGQPWELAQLSGRLMPTGWVCSPRSPRLCLMAACLILRAAAALQWLLIAVVTAVAAVLGLLLLWVLMGLLLFPLLR